jgi:hypothetical protein
MILFYFIFGVSAKLNQALYCPQNSETSDWRRLMAVAMCELDFK